MKKPFKKNKTHHSRKSYNDKMIDAASIALFNKSLGYDYPTENPRPKQPDIEIMTGSPIPGNGIDIWDHSTDKIYHLIVQGTEDKPYIELNNQIYYLK